MRRAVAGFWWSPTTQGTPALVVTAAFFTLGSLAGAFLALRSSASGIEALGSYLAQFLSAAQEGGLSQPALPELLWRALRWPLGAFFLGFTAMGLLGVPILASLRGFFLTFSVASFALAFGRNGVAASFLLLGIPGIFYLPAFFLLCTQSFLSAWTLAAGRGGTGHRETGPGRDQLLRCGVCAAAVTAGLFTEKFLVPILLSGTASMLA